VKLTEGQRYTVVILLVAAVLLSTSLTRLNGRVAELISAPGPTATTTTSTVAPRIPAVTTPSTTRAVLPPPTSHPAAAVTSTTRASAPPSTTTTTTGDGTAAEPPCPADDVVQGTRKIFEQVDALLGGLVPSATLTTTVAILTGCSKTEPLVVILAALIELGEGLPDLHLGAIEIPVLPFLSIPDVLIELLQPLRPLFDPLCDTVGTVGLLLSQVGPAYPYPLDKAFAVSLFYLTSTCGQIQGLGS
jgi:hypothetical protein